MSFARRIVTINRKWPLLGFAGSFITGQLLSAFFAASWAVSAALLCVLTYYRLNFYSSFAASALAGGLSFLAVIPAFSPKLENGRSYLATVLEEPRRRKIGELAAVVELLKVEKFEGGLRFLPSGVKVLCRGKDLGWENEHYLEEGSIFFMKASYRRIEIEPNPFSYRQVLLRRGISYECTFKTLTKPLLNVATLRIKFRRRFSSMISDLLGDGERGGLFLSMTVGTRDRISNYTEYAFKRSGMAHLLVVSGYQISLVYYSALFLITILMRSVPHLYLYTSIAKSAALLSLGIALLYSWLTDLDMSVIRALLAAGIFVTARLLDRQKSYMHSLILSLLALHVFFPLCIFEPGVQLTYAALLSFAAFEDRNTTLGYIKTCVLASSATSVIAFLWFGQFSWLGLILNPLFAPLISLISCNGGFFAAAAFFSGIDREGKLINIVADLLEHFRDFIIWITAD